jgi:hypothetical protein
MGGRIAAELIGDESPWLRTLAVQQLPEEAFGCTPVATGLEENIDHVAVLVDCPPQVVPAAADGDEQFVQVPRVAEPPLPAFEAFGVPWPKLEAPLPDGLIGDGDPPLGQEIFGVAEAQTEAVIQPNGVADDFRGESISVIRGPLFLHRPSLLVTAST